MSLVDMHYTEIKCVYKGQGRSAHLALCRSDSSLVVVKKINLKGVSVVEQEEVRKEAEILKILSHPNIIKFRDFFQRENEQICIVMEYADGGDLHSKIQTTKDSFFSENQILDWFTQIALALKHMHDRKIVHRDVKSSNIFLTSMNVVKLGDFGISSFLSHTNDFLQSFAGTYFYLSPEIISNRPYNSKTDMWSLGVVLYELCAKKLPFNTQKNDKRLLETRIKNGKYDEIPLIYSVELRELVSVLLRTDPAKRPNVNEILKKEIVRRRIGSFLSEAQVKEEFSHTVIHRKTSLAEPVDLQGKMNWNWPVEIKKNELNSVQLSNDDVNNPLTRIQNELNVFLKKNPVSKNANSENAVVAQKVLNKKPVNDFGELDFRKMEFKKLNGNAEIGLKIKDAKINSGKPSSEFLKDFKKAEVGILNTKHDIELEEKMQNEKRRKFYDKVEFLKKELKTSEELKQIVENNAKNTPKKTPKKSDSKSAKKIYEIENEKKNQILEESIFEIQKSTSLENLAETENARVLDDLSVKIVLMENDKKNFESLLQIYKDTIQDIEMGPTVFLSRDPERIRELGGTQRLDQVVREIQTEMLQESGNQLSEQQFLDLFGRATSVKELAREHGDSVYLNLTVLFH